MFTLGIIDILSGLIFGFIEGIVGLRILLKFFGANELTPFVTWVYHTSQPLLVPFEGMFPSVTEKRGFTIDVSSLFALLVYAFIAFFIQEAINGLQEVSYRENVRGKKNSREKEEHNG